MKQIVIAAAVLTLSMATGVRAEDAPGKAPGAPGAPAVQRPQSMKEALGLSDEQQAKIRTVQNEQRDAAKPLHDRMREQMATLKKQQDSKADPKAIEATLAEVKKTRDELRALHEKTAAAMDAILTPEQRAKKALMEQQRRDLWKAEHGAPHASDAAKGPHGPMGGRPAKGQPKPK